MGLGAKSHENVMGEKLKMEENDPLHVFFFFLQFENRLHHFFFVGTPPLISWEVGAVRARLESQSSGR